MSRQRPGASLLKTLASHGTRLYQLALKLLDYVRRARQPRQARLLHEGTLCRLELGFYHVVIVPLVAFLPAPLAYGVAYLQGNVRYHLDKAKRKYTLQGLEGVLGDQMSRAERIQVTRDIFRLRSCEAVDVMRMAGKGRALTDLVEIRGREHIEAALVAGKGAILCCAHFGSYNSAFSVLGALGFPITGVGRIPSKFNKNRTFLERLIFQVLVSKPLMHHRNRANIEPRGQLQTAFQAAQVLRQNEILGILIDPPVLPIDRHRTIPVDFLNGQAQLIPGMTTIAQLIGSPVLMTFLRRSPDWRHQVLEISPPMPMDGDAITAFKRCVAVVETEIRQNPAHWHYWGKFALMDLGLLSEKLELVRRTT
ncbi:MAG TPA: hypothetical protein DHW02_16550 [Ktedonobacter sp.]|nr:hypothetical protein [Ktedonobacter sp.]